MMRKRRIAYLFPGQGAQYVGMGKDFYDSFLVARETFEEGDSLLHRSLSRMVFEGPNEALIETRNCQAGIYLNSVAILRVIQNQFPDLAPQVCAGLSLGEYTALTAAGYIDFKTCLPLVQDRGEAMHSACEEKQGTMAAIFGLTVEEINHVVDALPSPKELWVANCNCPGQTVISGTIQGVEAGIALAKQHGAKRAIPLRVHGAFHSGLMQSAKRRLEPCIEGLAIQQSSVGIVMNVPGDFVIGSDAIKKNLIEQVTAPVLWEQGILKMTGIDLFIEIGCGKVLAGMNKQIGVAASTISINAVEDLDKLGALE